MDARELTFLVAEDHDFQRDMLVQMLVELRAKAVYSAENGRLALDVLKKQGGVDIVISDLDMPTMDGMEFIRHIGLNWKDTSLVIASAVERDMLASVETMALAHGGIHSTGWCRRTRSLPNSRNRDATTCSCAAC